MVESSVASKPSRSGAQLCPEPARSIVSHTPLRQLIKIVWPAWCIAVLLPLYAVRYSLPGSRPVRTWPWFRTVLLQWVKAFRGGLHRVSDSNVSEQHLTLKGLRLGDAETTAKTKHSGTTTRAVWMDAVNVHDIKGELKRWLDATQDKLIKVPGYWYGLGHSGDVQAKSDELVLLVFHGGGYALGTAYSSDFTSSIVQGILKASIVKSAQGDCKNGSGQARFSMPTRALSVDYRLSSSATLAGILADALAGYLYLVDKCGFTPEQIVIVGDSAGAHLTTTLVRYLRDTEVRPPPRGVVLISPWSDLSMSWYFEGEGAKRNIPIDFLSDGLTHVRDVVVRRLPLDAIEGPYIAPVTRAKSRQPIVDESVFKNFPPALVLLGGRERLVDEIEELVKVYKAGVGQDNVQLHTEPEGAHDFLALRRLGLFKEEFDRTTAKVADWLWDLTA
ncbi:hypothetical protein OIO90_006327 [Microbotryomycetes sp. JL221]|nr:hypothetical protein OIO90_006327 [Microbotryomycetes sp. JL221]